MPKVCATSAAGLKLSFPACEARTVQRPECTIVTVFPATVQLPTVWLLNVTGKVDDAVAPTSKGASP